MGNNRQGKAIRRCPPRNVVSHFPNLDAPWPKRVCLPFRCMGILALPCEPILCEETCGPHTNLPGRTQPTWISPASLPFRFLARCSWSLHFEEHRAESH